MMLQKYKELKQRPPREVEKVTPKQHNQMVNDFLAQKKEEDPEAFAAVEAKYPTIPFERYLKRVRKREQPVGLLGLQPAHISTAVASEYLLESQYDDFGDE